MNSQSASRAPAASQDLPLPVQRYFQYALPVSHRPIRIARLRQTGEFRTSPTSPWKKMTARQAHSPEDVSFIWDAKIQLAPLLSITVRDSYLHGTGSMQAKLASVIPIVNARPSRHLNSGALLRYLAEAIWFPTALLPEAGVDWFPLDDSHARASFADHGNIVTLDFAFNEQGQITGTYAPNRQRESHGTYIPTPWQSTCGDYETHHGVRIPCRAEVAWIIDGQPFPYWRARISDVEYEF